MRRGDELVFRPARSRDGLLPQRHLVLLGAGHTHAHVLRMWRMAPLADARLTLISDRPTATYSGMLPGTLAGLYRPDEMEIDLVRLAAAARARLIVDDATGVDPAGREVLFAERPPLGFDVLSIGIGSVPRADFELPEGVIAIKPMQTFLPRLDRQLARVAAKASGEALRIAVVGGGAGGVEIAFCLRPFVVRRLGARPLAISLLDRGQRLVPDLPAATAAAVERRLRAAGVGRHLDCDVRRIDRDEEGSLRLETADGRRLLFDLVLWSTGAEPPPLLANLALPKDQAGFLLTRPTLQTAAEWPIFAVGDTGSIAGQPRPKAGVYAVRQGPILWENLGRLLRGAPLVEYRPQPSFLSLLATGDRRAILSYKGRTFEGRWCWRLKDRIDSRFIRKYHDYTPREPRMQAPLAATRPMRCTGCGGKVGQTALARALARLAVPTSPAVMSGLDEAGDAAILAPRGNRRLAITTDFFSAFFDDPYLVGRIAAQHAASDLFAVGSMPLAALALAVIPEGPARQQEELLYELLAGGLAELRTLGATIVGGHTTEGPQLMIGFTMLGDAGGSPAGSDVRLARGDCLVLTKPLGTGVLLAAHSRARLRALWHQALVASMLQSNAPAISLWEPCEVRAVTDVTGFGLAGHLLNLLGDGQLAAELDLAAVPLLPGAAELLAGGLESTLAPSNRDVEIEMQTPEHLRRRPEYQALFDPQTAGGMLLGIAPHRLDETQARLRQAGFAQAAVIGRVVERGAAQPRLRVG